MAIEVAKVKGKRFLGDVYEHERRRSLSPEVEVVSFATRDPSRMATHMTMRLEVTYVVSDAHMMLSYDAEAMRHQIEHNMWLTLKKAVKDHE